MESGNEEIFPDARRGTAHRSARQLPLSSTPREEIEDARDLADCRPTGEISVLASRARNAHADLTGVSARDLLL